MHLYTTFQLQQCRFCKVKLQCDLCQKLHYNQSIPQKHFSLFTCNLSALSKLQTCETSIKHKKQPVTEISLPKSVTGFIMFNV